MAQGASNLPADGTDAGEGRLPLTLTVAFSGHRAIDSVAEAERLIGEALAATGRAFDQLTRSPHAEAFDGVARMRLVTGAAPGADHLVAAAWRAAGLGRVHPIYPFRDAAGAAFSDLPGIGGPETRIEPAADGGWTGLDSTGLGLARDQGHAEVGRWIVRHADLLIAWWNGAAPAGPGGAADTIRRALERGVPVVWLKPGETHPRLIDPAGLRTHADIAEAMIEPDRVAEALGPDRLFDLLAAVVFPPGGAANDPETIARRDYATVDPLRRRPPPLGLVQALLDRTLWRFFRAFERMAGRGRPPSDPTAPPPASLSTQAGFVRLQSASDEAIARANHLSGVHRSEQLILILVAIAAVFTGALPALISTGEALQRSHVVAAAIEFTLGFGAFFIARAARGAHRHRRWSDARRLAERLRAAASTWPFGFDIADLRDEPPRSWTEWRAKALIRAAGLPTGWIDRPRVDAEAAWVGEQLIGGQIEYHHRQRHIAENIERFVQAIEGGAFGVLMLTLFGYLALSLYGHVTDWEPPHWVGGLVTLLSAVTPAVGGGCLALEATNGFGELALHSAGQVLAFRDIRARLDPVEQAPYHRIQAAVRHAAELVVQDADAWHDRVLRRRIVRG